MDYFSPPNEIDTELRDFLQKSCDLLCNWYSETTNSEPLPGKMDISSILPEKDGLSESRLISDFKLIMDASFRPSHPGSLAHLDPPPLISSIAADMICAGLNNNMLANELSPSLSKLEDKVCDWFAKCIGFSESSGGALSSGGSLTNLSALVVARNECNLRDDSDAVIIASKDSHYSLQKAIKVMGLPESSIRRVDTDSEGRMCLSKIEDELRSIKNHKKKCFAIVATAGTTIRGSIDPLIDLKKLCVKEGIWLHIDGAIGGIFGIDKTTKSIVEGLNLADSLSINPQKILGIAKTSSILLLSNKKKLRDTFGTNMPYLEPMINDDINGGEIGIQGTRPAEILKLWIGLRQLGQTGIKSLLQGSINRRVIFEELLDSSKFDIKSGPLHLLALTPKNMSIDDSFNWAKRTREHLLKNSFMISKPYYSDRHHIKVVFGNPHTSKDHILKLSELLNQSIK